MIAGGCGLASIAWVGYQVLHRRNVRFNIKSSLEQTFLDVATVLNNHQIDWFLDYGTLLGWYRDGAIMVHEFDVDVAVHRDALPQVFAAIKMLPRGYYLKKPRHGNFSKWNGFSIKIRHRWRRGNLDIFIYYPFKDATICQGKACRFENGVVVNCVPKEGFEERSASLFFPLKQAQMTVLGQTIPCLVPQQTERYIQALYGDDLRPDMAGLFGNRWFIKRFWR